jgi:hypothetical protein
MRLIGAVNDVLLVDISVVAAVERGRISASEKIDRSY